MQTMSNTQAFGYILMSRDSVLLTLRPYHT